jgi:hypothetical protein
MPETYADLQIRIFEKGDQGYPVEITSEGREFPRGYLAADIVPWVPTVWLEKDGERLFNRLIHDPRLRSAWDTMVGARPNRRIRLRIDHAAPELQPLPWELMRDTTQGAITCTLSADRNTPFSRYVPGQSRRWSCFSTHPIKLLVVIANPQDLDKYHLSALDVETEEGIIRGALGSLEGKKQVEVSFLPPPVTLAALNSELGKRYQILHYVGHGRYLDQEEQAFLSLANQANRTVWVSDRQFAEMLARKDGTLGLVFLASCQTGMSSPQTPFRGLAAQVVAAGIPAVLAMQDLVSVDMTRQLTETFYQELLSHGQVDVALNEARGAVIVREMVGSWGNAALFSRLKGNRIFKLLDMAAERESHISKAATIPSGTTRGGVLELAASQTPQENREMQATLGGVLAQVKEDGTEEMGSEQIQVDGVQVSHVKLLLSKAALLEAEAVQMLRAHIDGNLPRLVNKVTGGQSEWQAWRSGIDTPFKARLRAGLEQGLKASLPRLLGAEASQVGVEQSQQVSGYITDRLLADFDTAAYEGKINEAYALVEEARALEPENVEVSLHEARLMLALHPDDPGKGQRLLYRLTHRFADPQDDEGRVQLGKTLYLLAGAQEPVNQDLLRQAHQLFVTAGDEELIAQAELDLANMLVARANGLRVEAEQALMSHSRYKVQQFSQGRASWQSLAVKPPPGSFKARLMVRYREEAKGTLPPTFWSNQPRTNPAQQEATLSALLSFIVSDFDDGAFQAKLNEAYTYLQEAGQLAPDSPAVFLEKAEVLAWLTPADVSDEQATLQQVRHMLQKPRDAMEKAWLARAAYALATLGSSLDQSLLQEARGLYAELGWESHVAACDALLSPRFDPVGRWQIRVGDGYGSTMEIWLQPDGRCMGAQQAGPYGGVAQFAGYWGYDPDCRMLQLQVLVNGIQSYSLGIEIQGEQGNGYVGQGTDGYAYFVVRMG